MKSLRTLLAVTVILCTAMSCKKDKEKDISDAEVHDHSGDIIPIDQAKFAAFFAKYPEYKDFRPEIEELYSKHNHYIWHDKKGVIEFAEVLFNRANQINKEGLPSDFPYKQEISSIFYDNPDGKPEVNRELLISSMYFYYTKKVHEGLDPKDRRKTGWYLPGEKVDYVAYLDTLMKDPGKIQQDKKEFFSQYYNLKKGLQKYRNIEKKGGWGTISMQEGEKSLKPGDSSATIAQIRKRLFAEGYLKNDSGKAIFDDELLNAIGNYEQKHGRDVDSLITPGLVKDLNVPVKELIKKITVNMERCRWMSADLNTAKEYIAVNIPSYSLNYFRDGKPILKSRVVVGKEMNKTVVFSGQMSYLAFSPYWNVPNSILEKEILPAIEKNPNYLEQNNMEWHDERVRQKPGGKNSLGLVKFMFPNSNNIYLHDTPAKSLFNKDDRAFSHGCVRVEKARELAIEITRKDGGWNEKKVDAAMNAGKENTYKLKEKIPVYIAYFTAWADEDGNTAFYDDIYDRDNRLANMLYSSK